MKSLLVFFWLFPFAGNAVAQQISSAPSITIDTTFTAVTSKEDVINITVSNPLENGRQLTIEIVVVEEENRYWGTIYSAAINEDYYFFKQWRDGRKMAEKMNVKFALPRYNKVYHSIDGDEAKDFSFRIKGNPIQKGMPVQVKVTVLDTNEVIYSPTFYLYKQPDL